MVYALAHSIFAYVLRFRHFACSRNQNLFFCLFFNQIGRICCSFQHLGYRFLCYFRSRAVLPHHFSSLVTFTISATRNVPHNSNSQPCVSVCVFISCGHDLHMSRALLWQDDGQRLSRGRVWGEYSGMGMGFWVLQPLHSHRCEVNRVVLEETSSAPAGSQGSSLDEAPEHGGAPGLPHPTSMCQDTQDFCTPP